MLGSSLHYDPEDSTGQASDAAQTADSLKGNHGFAREVLESITDGFAAMDADWRFVYINEPGLKILTPLRKTRENLLGRILWE